MKASHRVYILGGVLVTLLYFTREQTTLPVVSMVTKYVGPRGIRNNNPGNIRADGTSWVGKVGDDGAFVIFDTPENGIRAMTKILRSYAARGVDTIQKIISTWAPPHENNVSAYVNSVVNRVGKSANAKINAADYRPLISAIIWHENGLNPYPDSVINAGIQSGLT